jgi:hypothetical protein
MSWQALRFALGCDKCDSTAERVVLIEYANHADHRGYTWPSKRFIGSRCRLHHETVARATDTLIAKKLIFRTKKRRGNTGQVEVFRMPKCTYESGLQTDASKSAQSVGKASGKRRVSGTLYDTNLEPITMNHEEERMASQKPYLSSSSEERNKSRPALNRPTDEEEVINHLTDDNEFEGELEIEDCLWFFEANNANGWKIVGKPIEDWRAYARATFYARKFPSQRKKKK